MCHQVALSKYPLVFKNVAGLFQHREGGDTIDKASDEFNPPDWPNELMVARADRSHSGGPLSSIKSVCVCVWVCNASSGNHFPL